MDRRSFLVGLGAAVNLPVAAVAQQAKVPRIGVLAPAEPSPNDPVLVGFRGGLGDLGYVEGRNIEVEYVLAHGQTERFSELVTELTRRKVDIVVVGSTRAAVAAKEGLRATPIVFVGVVEPVAAGLVASLGRPGGHVTGLSFSYEDGIGGKWVELLHKAAPQTRRIAVLRDPGYRGTPRVLEDVERAGQVLGLKLRDFDVRGPDEFAATFAAIAKDRADAILVQPVPFFNTHQSKVIDLECTLSDHSWRRAASCRTA